jgi:uncharacterized protein with FMN-binding domain
LRRAVLTLGGTAAALAALFSFRTHVPGVEAAATGPATPAGPSASATPLTTPAGRGSAAASGRASQATPRASATSASASPKPPKSPVSAPTTQAPTRPVTTPARAPSSSAPTQAPPTSATPTPAAPRTITGPEEQTQYGPVQVTITVSGSKITAASGSTLGQGDQIGQGALPQLNSEAVAAQNASIQAVSGATYTSNGYIESLQSAVDQAGL